MTQDQPPKHDTKTIAERLLGKNAMRPAKARRFYKSVGVTAPADGARGHAVVLDGRPVKTPKKRALSVPSPAFAQAIAAEWARQETHINPAAMPLTRIANTAIDAVADMMADVAADIVQFAGSDLLCYRAEGPQPLVARQAAAWDQVLDWARIELGARFVLAQGIVPVEQPAPSLDKVSNALAGYDAFQMTGLHVITTLTGSALLALAHARGVLSREAVWEAAHVDEDWQIEQWGADVEAQERRAVRWTEFEAASKVLEFT